MNFHTYSLSLIDRVIEYGLNATSLIDINEIECKGCDPLEKALATCIIWESDLVKYLTDKQFKFKDGSILTFPDTEQYKWMEHQRHQLGLK